MRSVVALLLSLLLVCPGSLRAAQPAAMENGAARLSGLLASLESYTANFEHQLRDGAGTLLDASSGWVAWQRPSSFRWEILQPLPQTLLIRGDIFYQHDRDLEQMLVQPLSEEVALLPRLLLEGDAEAITGRYEIDPITALPGSHGAQRGARVVELFRLKPRSAGVFREMLLEFDGNRLAAINILDDMLQSSRFEFSARSAPVDDSLFSVEPPPGTEIIHQ